ncbi:MAG: hypothetical protein ABSD27_00470 [Bryobacteraceae bacterium]
MAGLWFRWLIVGLAPALAVCAEPNRSWETLMQSLQPGNTVVVTRMSSAQLEGKLLGITTESISVKWNGQPQVVPREDVYRVRMANIRRRHTFIGMALGGAGGAVLGAVVAAKTNSGGTIHFVDIPVGIGAVVGGATGAGIGAGVGAALPLGPPLYQVAGPPRRAAGAAAQK